MRTMKSHWLKRARTPVLLACLLWVAGPGLLAGQQPAETQARGLWTTFDLVDERIAVDGQYALIRMCRRQDADATSMLSAILDETQLAGIYQVDYQVPAMRARALQTWWWQLIPTGEDSTCVAGLGGNGELAPMIVYRKDIGPYPERVETALKDGWRICREKYELPQLAPIPCSIRGRPIIKDWTLCPEKAKPWWRIYDDCHRARGGAEAVERCEEPCGQVIGSLSELATCMSENLDCHGMLDLDRVCSGYADKQVSCP